MIFHNSFDCLILMDCIAPARNTHPPTDCSPLRAGKQLRCDAWALGGAETVPTPEISTTSTLWNTVGLTVVPTPKLPGPICQPPRMSRFEKSVLCSTMSLPSMRAVMEPLRISTTDDCRLPRLMD